MAFNLQSRNKGSYLALGWFLTGLIPIGPGEPPPEGSGIIGPHTDRYQTTIEDNSYGFEDTQAEYFTVQSLGSFEPDRWHHLLLSFDISGSCSIGPQPSSSCYLWYAIDDQDYRGVENMGPYRKTDDGLGPNTIVTRNVWMQSGFAAENYPRLFFNNWVPAPSGGCTPGPLPSDGADMGIPSSAAYVDAIFRVEMAEFQMWTGVTLDTGITSNRRAFVDVEGKPVKPVGTPQAPAEELLGKKPELMLHGSSKWQAGSNTGTLTGGQFTPVAGIEKYKPEPALGA